MHSTETAEASQVRRWSRAAPPPHHARHKHSASQTHAVGEIFYFPGTTIWKVKEKQILIYNMQYIKVLFQHVGNIKSWDIFLSSCGVWSYVPSGCSLNSTGRFHTSSS